MLTVASLLAAMTIAGAFWVGVLAARRLRDWGEGRRAIEEGPHAPLALVAASGAPPDDARTRRVRELVAQRLHHDRARMGSSRWTPGRSGPTRSRVDRGLEDLGLPTLRVGDVIVVEVGHTELDGDYFVDGFVHLREGGTTTVVANEADGDRRRWLIGSPDAEQWMLVAPVVGHGLSGEPPRHIRRAEVDYALQRRGQASAAGIGRHDRPELPRVATYVYSASSRDVLWLERWGHEVLVGEGAMVDRADVSFLPGG
jgi:hypothetical protein